MESNTPSVSPSIRTPTIYPVSKFPANSTGLRYPDSSLGIRSQELVALTAGIVPVMVNAAVNQTGCGIGQESGLWAGLRGSFYAELTEVATLNVSGTILWSGISDRKRRWKLAERAQCGLCLLLGRGCNVARQIPLLSCHYKLHLLKSEPKEIFF